MPIEHEYKYVLKLSNQLEPMLKSQLEEFKGSIHEIQQAYIGKEGRIRKKTLTHHQGKAITKDELNLGTEFIFTYKHKLSKRKGSLEFETNITQDDFDLAWNEEKNAHLTKTRITLNTL